MFFYAAKEVLKIFPFKSKVYFIFIQSIFLINMFLETLTIALFLPLISLILGKSIDDNSLFKIVDENFNINLSNIIPDYNFFILFFINFWIKNYPCFLIVNFKYLTFQKIVVCFLISNLFKRYINTI